MRNYKFEDRAYTVNSRYLPVACFPETAQTSYTQGYQLRGRADSQVGPKPFSTAYFAFDYTVLPQLIEYQTEARRTYSPTCRKNLTRMKFEEYLPPIQGNSWCVGSRFTTRDTLTALYPNVSSTTVGSARSAAINALNAKNVNLGITIGESKETLTFIADTVIRGLKAANALRKGNFSLAAYHLDLKTVKGGAKNYLAYLFGFQPLMNDIYHAVGDVRDQLSRPDILTIKKAVVNDVTPSDPLWRFEGQIQEGCEVGYLISIENRALSGLSALGLTNPLALAWELVPLSFVINWFISVGTMLDGLDTNLGLKVIDGYQTTFVNVDCKAYYRNGASPSYHLIRGKSMERILLPYIQNPGLYVNMNLNLGKLTTMMALIKSRI